MVSVHTKLVSEHVEEVQGEPKPSACSVTPQRSKGEGRSSRHTSVPSPRSTQRL